MMKILKKLLLFMILFQNNYFLLAVCTEKPLLVVISMVKNEQPVMEKTLKPFFDAGLQHYLILDTGSTDGTVQTVCDLFKKYKITHGYIEEKPFVDFATSRNHALDCAEKLFPGAVFFLMIDAEWYVHNVAGLIQFCEQRKDDDVVTFSIKRMYPLLKSYDYINWLFKARKAVRYYGVVHEFIKVSGKNIKVPEDIYIESYLSGGGNKRSDCRWNRDLDMLLKQYKKNPNDIHTIFYLGQTHTVLKNYKKALFWYKKRCNAYEYSEANYTAHYRVGIIYQQLDDYFKALSFLFKAYSLRPQRIEPLISIILYYLLIHDYHSAFILGMFVANQPIPSTETCYLMPEAYYFTRYYLLANAAQHVGEYEIAQKAILKALEYDPLNKDLQQQYVSIQNFLKHFKCTFLSREHWCKWCKGALWLSRPAWFNTCCLSFGINQSNRCNTFYGNSWRCWFGPAFV